MELSIRLRKLDGRLELVELEGDWTFGDLRNVIQTLPEVFARIEDSTVMPKVADLIGGESANSQ